MLGIAEARVIDKIIAEVDSGVVLSSDIETRLNDLQTQAELRGNTIEMTDFTIRVKNLPHHTVYGDKDDILRAMLIAHFEELIRDEVKLL